MVQLDGELLHPWKLMDLTIHVTGGNPTFDPDILSTVICQTSHRGIREFSRVIFCSAESMVTWGETTGISGKGHSGHLFC